MLTFFFRSFVQEDLPMLFQWFALPHVAKWWGESNEYAVFEKKYRQFIGVDDVGFFCVYHEDKPMGFIGWSLVYSDNHPEKTYGVDVFIADTAYIGKGYGPLLIQQFISQKIMPLRPNKIVADPAVTNLSAIRAYEKAGFKKIAQIGDTEDTQHVADQLMELDLIHFT